MIKQMCKRKLYGSRGRERGTSAGCQYIPRYLGWGLCSGLWIIGLLLPVWAGENKGLSELIRRVQQRYEETQSLQAHFQQITLVKTLGEEQQSGGVVFIKKPGMMRWEYQQGERQLLVSDGHTLWFYLPGEQQVIQEPIERLFQARSPTLFLAGKGKLEDIFHIEAVPGGDENPALRLIPKDPHPTLQELVLRFDPQTFNIVESQMIDFVGNVTTLQFTNIQVNVDISPDLFHFDIPPGIEIITPSQAFPRP